MKTLKIIIAILLFLPITICFVISTFFEMFWLLFNGLHPVGFQTIELPEKVENIVYGKVEMYFLMKIIVLIFYCLEQFFKRLKSILDYQFIF